MITTIESVKQNLDASIEQLAQASLMFSQKPGVYFTRNRKLPFQKVISCLLSMEGGTLTSELLKYYDYSADVVTSSAFVQQRSKISSEAFPVLFDLFVKKTDVVKQYKGLRLIAADGSDIQIPTNPHDADSYFPGSNGQKPYNMLHLDAMYDLLTHTYMDASLLGQRKVNERSTLCSMVDRSSLEQVLLIADRGYEGFNLMAHIQEKNWKFLIRIQDTSNSRGIAAGLELPNAEAFDLPVELSLTTKATNEVKRLCKDKNKYRMITAAAAFDYLPKKNRKHEPTQFYKLKFRVVRFKISEDTYETVITNLDSASFPPHELKMLYNMRWGIETSFRELKHTLGLLHFHAKKVEFIHQEVFARLIMYNFTELVTSHVIIQKAKTKYAYKANFSVAVHICRQFLHGNVTPPKVEALIRKHISPIRPGRKMPRKMTARHTVSFLYRVA